MIVHQKQREFKVLTMSWIYYVFITLRLQTTTAKVVQLHYKDRLQTLFGYDAKCVLQTSKLIVCKKNCAAASATSSQNVWIFFHLSKRKHAWLQNTKIIYVIKTSHATLSCMQKLTRKTSNQYMPLWLVTSALRIAKKWTILGL